MKIISKCEIKLERNGQLKVDEKKISTPQEAYEILKKYLYGVDREHLVVMGVNTKNVVNSIATVSVGSLNSSVVHPREVFKSLILTNSANFIIGHNHPSGDPNPSGEDINITLRLKECGKIMGIELLDHIILGDGTSDYISLKEKGFI